MVYNDPCFQGGYARLDAYTGGLHVLCMTRLEVMSLVQCAIVQFKEIAALVWLHVAVLVNCLVVTLYLGPSWFCVVGGLSSVLSLFGGWAGLLLTVRACGGHLPMSVFGYFLFLASLMSPLVLI